MRRYWHQFYYLDILVRGINNWQSVNYEILLDSLGQLGSRSIETTPSTTKKSKEQLKIIWKKAVFQQILLNRFERENQRLRGTVDFFS